MCECLKDIRLDHICIPKLLKSSEVERKSMFHMNSPETRLYKSCQKYSNLFSALI